MAGGGVGRTLVSVILGLVLYAGAFTERAGAWGTDGHHATCLLAEPLLESATLKAVRSLLPEHANGSLGQTRSSGCKSTIGRLHFITLIPLTFSAVTTTTVTVMTSMVRRAFVHLALSIILRLS